MVDFIQKNRNNRRILNDWLKMLSCFLNKWITQKKNKFSQKLLKKCKKYDINEKELRSGLTYIKF